MQASASVFKAADYLRLSKEDGDFSSSPGKKESNSISSQRDLIRSYVDKCPDIELVAEFVDDGCTGTNFERPSFQRMIDAVLRGEVNCIIVKDLSRFGREYIDSGNYIEKLFPSMGIRFISVNDSYDSFNSSNPSDSMIVPFKNLINDSYSRDISIKIRTNLETKRQRGEFIANYPVYGYKRDPADKGHLIVDEEAAAVVRDIFRWKIEGISPVNIAHRLNERGVLCPSAYKKERGLRYATGFQTNTQPVWNGVTIQRILTNEVYCGVLIQGRRTTANYKVRKVITKSEQDWVRIEGAHEAIINASQYHVVQRLMGEDCRSHRGEDSVHPLAGRVYCGDCGELTKRRVVSKAGKRYAYYLCPTSQRYGGCAPRTISEGELEETVLTALQVQISAILDIDKAMAEIDTLTWETRELQKLDAQIEIQREAIQRNNTLKIEAYEDFRSGVIGSDDFTHIKSELSGRVEKAEAAVQVLQRQKAELKDGLTTQQGWLAQFRAYRNIDRLTRAVVVTLIDRVLLYPDKHIRILLRNRDQLQNAVGFLHSQNIEVAQICEGVG